MANQAIALQARAPQTDFMGRAIQQNAQMMNMMSQRRAAERQAAQLAQAMEIARAEEGRAAAAAERQSIADQLDIDSKRATMLKSELGLIQSGDIDAVNAWVQRAKTLLPAWGDFIPPAETIAADRNVQLKIAGTIQQIIDKEVATPTSSVQIGKNARGEDVLLDVRSAGFGAPAALEIPQYSMQAPSGASAPPRAPTAFESAFPTSAAPATDAQIDEAARKITQGAGAGELGISAQDFDRASARANQMTAGGGARMQPISMTTGAQMGGQPDMTAVVQDMMSSKQISQSNLQLMREMAGPDKDAQLAQILKANNIQIVPDAQPQMRSAVFRPGEDAAPRMQQVQAIPPNYQPTGRAARPAKDPTQSPTPGVYSVPTPVIREQKRAEAQGSQDVEVVTGPQIAGGKKRAELQEQRDFDYPDATGRFETNLARLDSMLGEIDRLQNHDAYTRIIGPLDAFTPNIGRARGAQAIYNTLISMGTQEELQAMRRGNETGGAVGNVSDADIKLLERGFGALDQSQMEQDFDASVDVLVKRIKAARDRLVNQYRETYSYRLPKNWAAPAGPRRTSTKGAKKVGGFTVLEEED